MMEPLPVGVVVPEATGLWSLDGGIESPAGPMENLGVCFGCADTPESLEDEGIDVGATLRWSLCGEADSCGVTMASWALAFARWDTDAAVLPAGFPSRDLEAEGVRGGE